MEETKQENQETAEEPTQSPPVERVTKKVKDPKKVVAGRAGAATRKAKQEERLLEQLRVAKESFRPLRATARLPIFRSFPSSTRCKHVSREGILKMVSEFPPPGIIGAGKEPESTNPS